MNILAGEPGWCDGHLPSDSGVVHISRDQVVKVTAPDGREADEIYVSVERADELETAGVAAIRIQNASDQPMTPAQAMRLAAVLQAAAFAAVCGLLEGATR